MAEKTLIDLFPGATQTATSITIPKSDLGLTSATSTADHFVSAVVIKAFEVLTQTHFDSEYNQSVYVNEGYYSYITRTDPSDGINKKFQVAELAINMAKIAPNTLIPEDY